MGGGCCVGNCCIGDFFSSSSCGGGCGYNPGPSESEKHQKKIADELATMIGKMDEYWRKNEKGLLDYINSRMNSFLEDLKNLNMREFGGRPLNIDLEGIKERSDKLEEEVIGHVGNVLHARLVLTDAELKVILEERDDAKRKTGFDSFCKRVEQSAKESLLKKIDACIKAQQRDFERTVKNRLEEVNSLVQQQEEAYATMLANKQRSDKEAKAAQMPHLYVSGICQFMTEDMSKENYVKHGNANK